MGLNGRPPSGARDQADGAAGAWWAGEEGELEGDVGVGEEEEKGEGASDRFGGVGGTRGEEKT